jgi:hypothetical protein
MFRRFFYLATLILGLFCRHAAACGGGFGAQLEIKPQQIIVVTYRDGQENYIFQPQFCGSAAGFGLILPVPSVLTSDPSLADSGLYDQLAAAAAPRTEVVEVCSQFSIGSGSDNASNSDGTGGIDVVSSGKVGIFSWELLKADSTKSFTDWLDARSFPYPSIAQDAFAHYVDAGWYFIAFRVDVSALATSSRICGAFGPIALGFPAAQPVIPARMATAADQYNQFRWRVFSIAADPMTLAREMADANAVSAERRFTGQLSPSVLGKYPAVAAIAKANEWLTEYDYLFSASKLRDDMVLGVSPDGKQPFQRTIYVEKEVGCGCGCSLPHQSRRPAWILGVLAAWCVSEWLSGVGRRGRHG